MSFPNIGKQRSPADVSLGTNKYGYDYLGKKRTPADVVYIGKQMSPADVSLGTNKDGDESWSRRYDYFGKQRWR